MRAPGKVERVALRARSLTRPPRRRLGLRRLAVDPHPTAQSAGRALRAAVDGQASPEERTWMERIEEVRRELGRSEEVLHVRRSVWTADPSDDELEAWPVAELATSVSKPPRWGRALLRLVRELQPSRCVELGTCVGISGAYQAAALALNGRGGLVTLEAEPARAAIAGETFAQLGLDRVELRIGRFQDTLEPVLAEGAVDLAFIDGHHDERATVEYFQAIAGGARRPGVALIDDIDWSPGMVRAWRAIGARLDVALSVDLGGVGLCLLDESNAPGRHLRVPLYDV